jgi:hypothetical protein
MRTMARHAYSSRKHQPTHGVRNERHGQPTDYDRGLEPLIDPARAADGEDENSPLVQRLRNLRWPQVPPGVRERCWREFQQRIASADLLAPEPEPDPDSGS